MNSPITTMGIVILAFLSQYGHSIEDAPAIQPAFHNYHQDIGPGGSFVGNLTRLDGQRMFDASGEENVPTDEFQWAWYVDGVFMTDLANPTNNDLRPEADGVVMIKMVVTHTPTGVQSQRQYWAFLDFLDTPNIDDPARPSRFEVFIDYWPDYEAADYAFLTYDLNHDGKVSSMDLLTLLASF